MSMNPISFSAAIFVACASSAWSLFGGKACQCHCESKVDEGVLSLLRSQLARCGPEQLVTPDCPAGDSGDTFVRRLVDLIFVAPIAFTCGYLFGTRHSYQFTSNSIFQRGGESESQAPAGAALEDVYEFNLDAPRWSPPTDSSARRVRR